MTPGLIGLIGPFTTCDTRQSRNAGGKGYASIHAGRIVYSNPTVVNSDWLLVRDADYTHATYVGYIPTETLTPGNQGEVNFREYGDVAFLASLTVTGDTSGMEVLPGKHEKQTALAEHEHALNSSVPLTAIHAGN